MGLYYARKQRAAKVIDANKARAHARNHAAAKAAFKAEEEAKAKAEVEKPKSGK